MVLILSLHTEPCKNIAYYWMNASVNSIVFEGRRVELKCSWSSNSDVHAWAKTVISLETFQWSRLDFNSVFFLFKMIFALNKLK